MKNIIQNITIESLFEKDNKLEYWQLRERASLAGILGSDLFQLLKTAHTEGVVDMLPNNVIKFIGEIKPIEKRYKSTLTEGGKTPNNLCAAVKRDMLEIFEQQKNAGHTIEKWQEVITDCIAYHSLHFPRCMKPYVVLYPVAHYSPPRPTLVAYANERAYINNTPFITISVQFKF
jgi:hypothetical protein